KRLREAQLIGEIGDQAADIARTQGELAALKAAKASRDAPKEPDAGAPKKEWDAYNAGLRGSKAYQDTMKAYGTGSTLQRSIQAATAAVQGLAGGDLSKAIAGGSAPFIANVIGSSGLDDKGKILAHAAVNAALSVAQGNNALVGASGAATAELVGMIAVNAYGKPVSELSETEKQTVSALATLAAGLAGGLTGGSSADAVAGAQAVKNAVENNYLSSTEKSRQTELNHKQSLTPKEQQERDALNRKDVETSKTLVDACMSGSASACTAARKDALEKQDTYQSLGYQNQKEAQAGYQQIQQLLNGTSPEAKQTQELFNGMVAAYMRTGMREESAKSAVGYQLGAMYIAGGIAGIGSGKAVEGSLAGKNSTVKENAGIRPTVTAELEVNGQKFKDTNQTARLAEQANKDQPTLISDRVTSKEQSLVEKGKTNNLPLPNSNMANANAEIGAIQQAYNAGKTQDANLTINVAGKDVCSYCRGYIAAAQASGAKSVTINAVDDKTGLPKTYIWEPVMKSIREINK
ncbi:VENN motif pre-toxin domain-containing protein, partial [[Pantoea] beijingensis]|uniref:VENN motif pre-toxin domain-containing protein n=3 Tax=[Pantoea] beijingensis TaxID=1324864 RepID=UPI0019D44F20